MTTLYRTIAMDPPWMERGGGKVKRGADRHYPLLPRHEIARVVLSSPVWTPADDAHLWMWATSNHLEDAIWLIHALGFRYVTQAVWVKLRKGAKVDVEVRKRVLAGDSLADVLRVGLATGLGQYLRGQHELLLLATRGRGAQVRTDRRDLPSVVLAPRGKHSEKPSGAYALIEDRSLGPRVELFARESRPGWDVWGPVPGYRYLVRDPGGVRFRAVDREEVDRFLAATGAVEGEDGVVVEEVEHP